MECKTRPDTAVDGCYRVLSVLFCSRKYQLEPWRPEFYFMDVCLRGWLERANVWCSSRRDSTLQPAAPATPAIAVAATQSTAATQPAAAATATAVALAGFKPSFSHRAIIACRLVKWQKLVGTHCPARTCSAFSRRGMVVQKAENCSSSERSYF